MTHKFDSSQKSKLDNEWRRENLQPYKTLLEFGLTENDIVADIGCGIGYFTGAIAQIIKPKSKVYALDTSYEMLTELERRNQEKNIVTVNTDEYDFKLDDKMVSFSLVVNVLHEIDDKERFVNEIKRITGGKIAIIDWEKKITDKGPPVEDRLDKNDLKLLLKKMGIEIVKEMTFADCFYGIVGVVG